MKPRLICFPHAGSGSSFYLSWKRWLGSGVEIIPVCLPGRENRWTEKFITDCDTMIADLCCALRKIIAQEGGPLFFFGHSMGALLAWELYHALRVENSRISPTLILSAFPSIDVYSHYRRKAMSVDAAEYIDVSEELKNNVELWKLFKPILEADMALCQSYCYRDRGKVDIPLVVLGGLDDKLFPLSAIKRWSELSIKPVSFRFFPGGHFYYKKEMDDFFSYLSTILLGV